jgi:hypothetical protein
LVDNRLQQPQLHALEDLTTAKSAIRAYTRLICERRMTEPVAVEVEISTRDIAPQWQVDT